MHIRTGFPWWLRPFLFRNVIAITIGRRVYISDALQGIERERILAHERVHVGQIERVGFLRFCLRYLREYVRNRWAGMPPHEAYRRISFEQEALIIEHSVQSEDS
jgi:hypothetical protein